MSKKTVQNDKKECTHHWVIEPASGGDSQGKCKKCKLVREFSNSGWEDGRGGWGHSISTKGKESIDGKNGK